MSAIKAVQTYYSEADIYPAQWWRDQGVMLVGDRSRGTPCATPQQQEVLVQRILQEALLPGICGTLRDRAVWQSLGRACRTQMTQEPCAKSLRIHGF